MPLKIPSKFLETIENVAKQGIARLKSKDLLLNYDIINYLNHVFEIFYGF